MRNPRDDESGSYSFTRPFNGKTGEVLRFIGGALTAAFLAYFAMRERITVLETQSVERWNNLAVTLAQLKAGQDRIEDKQDATDAEFRRILQDWSRGVDRRTGEPLPLQRSIER